MFSKPEFPGVHPVMFPSPGLPLARQQYLYRHIRAFGPEPYNDIMCPHPEALPPDGSEKRMNRYRCR